MLTDSNKDVEYIQSQAEHFDVRSLIEPILHRKEFQLCSGAGTPNQHHYGDGGLLQHTTEVIKISLSNIEVLNLQDKILPKHMFLAAFYHDVGKMWDYVRSSNGSWTKTEHARRIHHISRSAIVWNAQCIHLNYSSGFIDMITHAILAHHGQREWGSPVAPATPLAWLLHLSDSISARMDDCLRNDYLVKQKIKE